MSFEVVYDEGAYLLLRGEALATLRLLDSDSVDALVTDPPSSVHFMGREWDSDKGGRGPWVAWLAEVMAEALRVLRPGGQGLVWALPRRAHWTAWALEDAGFEVRDCIQHHFGSGFPKNHNVAKAIDKAAGAERPCTREGVVQRGRGAEFQTNASSSRPRYDEAVTLEAKRWEGWGTALKPSTEFWWLVRKPLDSSVWRITLTKEVLASWEEKRCDRE